MFFDFIDLAKKLQPKIVIAENVKGLLQGNAISYVREIYKQLDLAGYYCQHFLLDASKMGVPQRRERVFFIALRKDLATPFLYQKDLITIMPMLKLEFKEPEIPYKDFEDVNDLIENIAPSEKELWLKTEIGNKLSTVHVKGSYFGYYKIDRNKVLMTQTAQVNGGQCLHYKIPRYLNDSENINTATFPEDYDFRGSKAKYICGMSVPPVAMAQIASEIYNQWLSKI